MKPEEIINLRLSKNWSQIQLADYFGVTQATISRWENGVLRLRGPALKMMQMLTEGIARPLASEAVAGQVSAGSDENSQAMKRRAVKKTKTKTKRKGEVKDGQD